MTQLGCCQGDCPPETQNPSAHRFLKPHQGKQTNWQPAAPSPPSPPARAAGQIPDQPLPTGTSGRGGPRGEKYPRHASRAGEPQLEKKSKLPKKEMPGRYGVPRRSRTFIPEDEQGGRKARGTHFSSPPRCSEGCEHGSLLGLLPPLCDAADTDGIAATDFCCCFYFLSLKTRFRVLGERLLGPAGS